MGRVRAPRKRTPSVIHWCFTINNPQPGDVTWCPRHMAYLIVGREVGDQGTPHLQCYVAFKQRHRIPYVKKLFPRAHIEDCKGTPIQNIIYCSKENDFDEYGTIPKTAQQVLQSKWDDAYLMAKLGNYQAIPKDMLIRYYHAFKRIHQDNPIDVENLARRENLWIVAPSGYGKSTYAREKFPDFYDKAPNKWFIGYKSQVTILCDDFGPKQCEYLGWYMKRWADIFPFPIEDKGGGTAKIRPAHIVVTSQWHPRECFEDPLVADAICNRFDIKELDRWEVRQLRTQEELDDRTATTVEYDSHEAEDQSVDLDDGPEDPDARIPLGQLYQ